MFLIKLKDINSIPNIFSSLKKHEIVHTFLTVILTTYYYIFLIFKFKLSMLDFSPLSVFILFFILL